MKRLVMHGLAIVLSAVAVAGEPVMASELTAEQIIEKNIAARGGLEAWQNIRTMAWAGHVESADAPTQNMQFVLEQELDLQQSALLILNRFR